MRACLRRPLPKRRSAPPEDDSSVLAEVRQLRGIARRLADLAERVLDGQPVTGNPWSDLLCEQDKEFCAR